MNNDIHLTSRQSSIPLSMFCRAAVIACALAMCAFSARADVLLSCTNASVGDSVSRAFYLPSYPGVTLDSAQLEFGSYLSGSFTIALTVRSNTYDGIILGQATNTFDTPGPNYEVKLVTFTFPSVPVVKYSRVCFSMAVISNTEALHFGVGRGSSGGCQEVIETVSSNPPVDTFLGYGVYLILTGSDDPNANLRLTASPQPGQVLLEWNSVAGRTYTVESNSTLQDFSAMQTNLMATSPTNSFSVPLSDAAGQNFYRVLMEPRPIP